MYPYFRLLKTLAKARCGTSLSLKDESVLKMRVGFSDIDFNPELNNGRHLTLMDMGRLDLAQRTGLMRIARKNRWGFVVAGVSVRYRYRLKAFQGFRLHTRIVGADERWFYFQQRTIRKGKTHSSALVKAGITSKKGIVPVNKVLAAAGKKDWDPGAPPYGDVP